MINANTYRMRSRLASRKYPKLMILTTRLDNTFLSPFSLAAFPTMELVWWFVQSSQESKPGTMSTVFYVSF
jgi:hypothetical protein